MAMSSAPARSRVAYCAALLVAISAGLASRSSAALDLPDFVATYAGDTLWAFALYMAICLVWRDARSTIVLVACLAVSLAVELSQLYRAGWLDAIRATRPGALLLGSGFVWTDLPCYLVGALLAFTVDRVLKR